MTTTRLLGLFIVLSSCAALGSRATEPPDAAGSQDTAATPPRTSYSIPAKQLHDRVAQAVSSPPINLKIASDENGRIMTDWQPYPGAVFGPVYGVGRHWQER